MDTKSVTSFFDEKASVWDELNNHNADTIRKILDVAGVKEGVSLLDVGCGTGVLFNSFFERGINDFTGIDISSKMVYYAKQKYKNINVLCGDAEFYDFEQKFDCIIIYNAFPHFINPADLFKNLCKYLNFGGRLTVAHGSGRDEILKCHSGDAKQVSFELPTAPSLASLMNKFVCVDIIISDEEKYIVSGLLKNKVS